jgi:hypothetical protein
MANWVQQDWTRSLTKANQASIIGNPRPPNMVGVKPEMLTAASPKFFNLQQTTGVDTTPSDNAANFCRTTYTGFGGLRKLQQDQTNRTYYDAGCGWRFNMGPGTGNPTINQGALGSYNGPVYGGSGDLDEVANSTTWDMNLQRAERNASTTLATNLNNKCENLQYLSAENQQFFGFCTSSGAIIPIQTDAQGNVSARYPSDITLACPSANIIPASAAPGSCPSKGPSSASAAKASQTQVKQAFRGNAGSDVRQGMGVKGNLEEAFSQKKKSGSLEPFGDTYTSINDLRQCKSPLTSDCIVLAARAAGCADKGSLITALQGIPKGTAYNKNLQNNQAYIAYNQAANPGITANLLKDGSVSLATALNDFGNILTNAQSKNPKVAAASRDLCVQTGYFENSYNWCNDMSPTSTIDPTNIACVQNNWRNQGGTPEGTSYPVVSVWQGKTFQSYLNFVKTIVANTTSPDKATQTTALLQFIGTSSTYDSITKTVNMVSALPTVSQTNGSETLWIDIGDYWNGSTPPVILRCDLMMATNGEIIPRMEKFTTDLKNKYSLPSMNGIAFMNAFEYRPSSDTEIQFKVTADDGFMIGINQNPLENTEHKKNDWGSWLYQPPTTYTSGKYKMKGDTKQNTNTIITKYFQGQVGSIFQLDINDGAGVWKNPIKDTTLSANMFLTQEPLAPWLQYETVTRENNGQGKKLGLFEKRWNGPAAFYENKGVNSPVPSFDVVSAGIAPQIDDGVGHHMFTPGSWWHTKALFAFTAFQTITLMVRPEASLSAGSFSSVFQHMNFINFAVNLWLYTADGKNYQFAFYNNTAMTYLPCKIGEFNMIVIQYNSHAQGIRNIQADAMDLPTLKTSGGLNTMFARISNHQSPVGPIIMPPITNEAQRKIGSGMLILGGSCPDYSLQAGSQKNIQSFTGDVAWIHGFRTPINTIGMLKAEVEQTWISRWPRRNIDDDMAKPSPPIQAPQPACISSAGAGITIRENCDATGWSKELSVGEYDNTKNPGSFPTDASYIIVPLGFKATIFTGSLGSGQSKTFEGPTRWNFCSDGWWANDKIKSIRVEASAGNQCNKAPIGSDIRSRNPMLIRPLDINSRPSSEAKERGLFSRMNW